MLDNDKNYIKWKNNQNWQEMQQFSSDKVLDSAKSEKY